MLRQQGDAAVDTAVDTAAENRSGQKLLHWGCSALSTAVNQQQPRGQQMSLLKNGKYNDMPLPFFFIGYNLLIKFCFVFSRSGQPRSSPWRGTWVTFLGLDGSDLGPLLWSSWVREQQEGGDWMVMIMMVSSRLYLTCLCLFSSMDVCWYARNNQLSTFIWDISDAYIVFRHLSQHDMTYLVMYWLTFGCVELYSFF